MNSSIIKNQLSRKYVISFSKWKYIYQRRRKFFSFHYTISCAADWVFNGCLFFAFSLHQLLQKILPLAFLGNNLYIVWWWLMLQGWCVSFRKGLIIMLRHCFPLCLYLRILYLYCSCISITTIISIFIKSI